MNTQSISRPVGLGSAALTIQLKRWAIFSCPARTVSLICPRSLILPPLLALIALFPAMKAKAQSSNSPVTAATLDWKSTRAGELKYLLYLPPDYSKSADKKGR